MEKERLLHEVRDCYAPRKLSRVEVIGEVQSGYIDIDKQIKGDIIVVGK